MKIGIVTYHRSHNYGALLQAVALRTVLQEMGHQAFFVDYWPDHQKKRYELFAWKRFKNMSLGGKLKYLLMFLLKLYPVLQRRFNFGTFLRDRILPYCISEESTFDVIIYGSDQIWRKQKEAYNPVYFGHNRFKASKHISYAASMGSIPSDSTDKTYVKSLLSHLNAISVRESDLESFLQELGVSDVTEVLDPTFLIEPTGWDLFVKKKQSVSSPYLIFYEMQKNVFDTEDVARFAKERGLKIIYLSGNVDSYPNSSKKTTAGPYEFLALIRSAEFVITTSFHGLAFSIIYNRPFFASFSSNSGRAKSLLDKLSLSDFLLPFGQKIPQRFSPIDWEKVNEKKRSLARSSLSYLKSALES